MKLQCEREPNGLMLRARSSNYVELGYLSLGLQGLELTVEFPSDWHEHKRGWLRASIGIAKLCISFPWPWVVEDHYQCSGPEYGFKFYEDLLWLRYGKAKGTKDDPSIAIYMPWHWKHREHKVLSEPEAHPYIYKLKNGTVQVRVATIKVETRKWTRWWYPFKKLSKAIDVTFDDEVGERSGSWKGGCIGCGYEMKPDETPLQTLRRMELERKF